MESNDAMNFIWKGKSCNRFLFKSFFTTVTEVSLPFFPLAPSLFPVGPRPDGFQVWL